MPLVGLVNSLRTKAELAQFSFDHARDHDEIDDALSAQKGLTPFRFPLDPFPRLDRTANWQEWHQQKHLQMNEALGLEGSGLTGFDFASEADRLNFVALNFAEHQNARQALGI